jgi:LmbE family N-acetylglucosaminyl deacetylase
MKAAKYYGAKRIILDFGDQKVKDSPQNRKIIKDIIKKIKPDLIFCPYFKDKHPDHAACGKLLKEHNPIFYLPRDSYGKANLVVDVKGYFRKRQKIINCFKSQNPLRWKAEIKKHLKKFGKKIGSNYGEGFICERKKKLENIFLPVN